MKLFGLIEQLNIESLFPIKPLPVSHSDLFKRFDSCKNKNKLSVGIQMDSTERVVKIPPLEFHGQEVFFELYEYFKNFGANIHFLESREYFENLAAIARKAKKINRKLRNNRGDEKKLRLEDYKLEVEFKYQQAIGINDFLLGNIARTKPELVFVGDGHANWFYLRRNEIKEKYGIEIEEYWRDVLTEKITENDLLSAASMSDEHLSMESILRDKSVAITRRVEDGDKVLPEIQTLLIQRSYDAVVKGRITDENPHFIGTWDLTLEPKGLFELFIEKVSSGNNGSLQFSGTVEDCLGSSKVEGTMNTKQINFTKKYYNTEDGASGKPIFYEGQIKDGDVVGIYKISSSSSSHHWGFKMKQLRKVA